MLRSEARWKIWGNSVPLMRFLVNLSALNNGLPDIILSSDSWDGYATERNELMAYLISNSVNNVISLSGDLHAHFAGSVMNNYDAQDPESILPEVTEFVCGSISSVSMFAALRQRAQRETPTEIEQLLQSLIGYETALNGEEGDNRTVNNLNNTLINGVRSGVAAAQTNLPSEIEAEKDHTVNGHLKYADTDGHGFGLVQVTKMRQGCN